MLGKRTAFLSGALGSVIIIASAYCFHTQLLEHWYIYRFKSGNEETRIQAAEILGRLKSIKAVPYMVEAITIGPSRESAQLLSESVFLTPIAFSLYSIGTKAEPYAKKTLDKQKEKKLTDKEHFRSIIVLVIITAWNNPSRKVTRIPYSKVEHGPRTIICPVFVPQTKGPRGTP